MAEGKTCRGGDCPIKLQCQRWWNTKIGGDDPPFKIVAGKVECGLFQVMHGKR